LFSFIISNAVKLDHRKILLRECKNNFTDVAELQYE